MHRPTEPTLDGERWFKTALATLWLQRVEREGGDADAWTAAVRANIPFSLVGRDAPRKLQSPQDWRSSDGLWLDGEQVVLQALATLEGIPDRWQRLLHDDEASLAALLDDPVHLGADWNPAQALGLDWATLATSEPEAVDRAIDAALDALWVVVVPGDGPGPLTEALTEQAGEYGLLVRLTEEGPAQQAEQLRARVADVLGPGAPERPVVLVGEGDGAHVLVRALVGSPGFRDRVLATFLVAARLRGREGEGPWSRAELADWWASHWQHGHLDTERLGRMPVFVLRCGQPDDPAVSEHLEAQWPGALPPDEDLERYGVRLVDLGLLRSDRQDAPELVARALRCTAAMWIVPHR